jgi:hypothetical protein
MSESYQEMSNDIQYDMVKPDALKIGDYAYFEGDLPGSIEDFEQITDIEKMTGGYFFQVADTDEPYPINESELVPVLRQHAGQKSALRRSNQLKRDADTNQQDLQILAEYQDGLEPLLDLPASLQIITEAGYQYTRSGSSTTLTHPNYEGAIHYKTDQDVIDAAEGLLQEALPDLSDEEASEH